MAYTPTQWVNGQPPALNAENLNKIEEGIADASENVEQLEVNIESAKELIADAALLMGTAQREGYYLDVTDSTEGPAKVELDGSNEFLVCNSRNIIGINHENVNVHKQLYLKAENSKVTLNGYGGMAWYSIDVEYPFTAPRDSWATVCKLGGTMGNYVVAKLVDTSGTEVHRFTINNGTTIINSKLEDAKEIAKIQFYAPEATFENCEISFSIMLSMYYSDEYARELYDGNVYTTPNVIFKSGYNAVIANGASSIKVEYPITSAVKRFEEFAKNHILGDKVNRNAISGALGNTITNTIESIKQSYCGGADIVEIDLRMTKDGKIALSHSNDLRSVVINSYLVSGKNYVSDYTMAELKVMPMLNWSTYFDEPVYIPSLDEALKLCKVLGLKVWLDLKTDVGTYEYDNRLDYIDTVIEYVKNEDMLNSCAFINVYANLRAYIREALPSAWIVVKTFAEDTTKEEDLEKAKNVGGNVIIQLEPSGASWPSGTITRERLNYYHINGYKVGAPYVAYDSGVDYVLDTNAKTTSVVNMGIIPQEVECFNRTIHFNSDGSITWSN